MNGAESVRKSHAWPMDAAAHEIIRADGHRGRVGFRSTRYLAEQQVAACERLEHDSRLTLTPKNNGPGSRLLYMPAIPVIR